MTVIVEAGCRVADLQKTLAEHGQRLALDPLWPERATIGGILSTNDSGTLRVRYGSLRDLIIGITVALPDGTLAKSGGKVVKNVAGYDLAKLFTGALGTLGVIAQAIFRLHPLPREIAQPELQRHARIAEPTAARDPGLETDFHRLATAGGAGKRAARRPLRRHRGRHPGPGQAGSADRRITGCLGRARQTPGPRTRPSGTAPRRRWSRNSACCRRSSRRCVRWSSAQPGRSRWRGRSSCRAWAPAMRAWKATSTALRTALLTLRDELAKMGGTLVALGCPLAVKRGLDVWGPPSDAQPLMVRIKQRFDPDGTLNPGRFVGGI